MKISVIIPTYKPQAYIWECLDSLVAQTFPKKEFEVILVLNGCKEPFESEIRTYLKKHSDLNVNFIQTNQGGVSNARNIALDAVKGEFVTFIDDDDYVNPSYLEELYAKSSPDTIGLCNAYAFKDGEPEKQLPYGITATFERLSIKGRQAYPRSRKYFSGPCMKLIPMSFIQRRRYNTAFMIGEDTQFMFLISDKFKYVDFTSKNAIYYRRVRENSAITAQRTQWQTIKITVKCIKGYIDTFSKGGYHLRFFADRLLTAIYIIMGCFLKMIVGKKYV